MTPLGEKLRDEILSGGPIRFSRFMELALYDPEHGYYRRARGQAPDPFGRSGDFFTAEQLQPVFGRLIASALHQLREEMGSPAEFTVVELGAGRAEMAEALGRFRYIPLEVAEEMDVGTEMPARFEGVVFSNEFFDALPVDLAVRADGEWREQRVRVKGDARATGTFEFVAGPPVDARACEYLARYAAPEQQSAELHFQGQSWMQRIAQNLTRGFVLTIDYGYAARETHRFPHGSLMSYRRHTAGEDVLGDPGERDITSHVPFQVLAEAGEAAGLTTVRLESMTQFLMRLGEKRWEEAMEGGHALQLKTLLYGMGETFRVLLQRKQDGPLEGL